jgi:hypothetical protein
MLLQEILEKAASFHHDKYIPRPISSNLASFEGLKLKWAAMQQPVQEKHTGYIVDSDDEPIAVDPFWGNNIEASTSTAPPVKLNLPWNASSSNCSTLAIMNSNSWHLTLIEKPSDEVFGTQLTLDQQKSQDLSSLEEKPDHQSSQDQHLMILASDQSAIQDHDVNMLQSDSSPIEQTALPSPTGKRKHQYRKRDTPVVDDMVRRSIRKKQTQDFKHVHLDFVKGKRGPRETPVASTLEDRLQCLGEAAAENGDDMLPVEAMQDLATQFCACPPEEVTGDILLCKSTSNE